MFSCLITILTVSDAKSICRGITFQGGGSHGAYEAGAFHALTSLLPPEDTEYDYVTGVSVGAINTGGMAMYE